MVSLTLVHMHVWSISLSSNHSRHKARVLLTTVIPRGQQGARMGWLAVWLGWLGWLAGLG